MERIEEFVDERQKSWCIHCGASIGGVETNEDHVPSRALLLKPYPANLPVVRVCTTCNNGFSMDEEYLFLFLRCVLVAARSLATRERGTRWNRRFSMKKSRFTGFRQ